MAGCNHEKLRLEVWRVIFFAMDSKKVQANIDAMLGKSVCCTECCEHVTITDEWLHQKDGAA